MGGQNIKSPIVRLVNFVTLFLGLLLIHRIHSQDPDFFTFSGNALMYIGTVLMFLYLTASAASKAFASLGKFYWWFPMAGFVTLMLFLLNLIPAAIFSTFPEKSAAAMEKTNYVPHFLGLVLFWLICDILTFSYVHPISEKKE